MIVQSDRIRVLILCVALATVGVSVPTYAEDTEEMVTVDPRKLEFTPIPDMPACATAAILRGNPRFGPAWVLLKLASGCQVPWHWHSANETLVVISGRGALTMKDGPPLQFVPGAYASLPSRHQHQANCTRTCLLFNTADAAFDIHYVDAKGEEISADEVLKPSAKPKARKK